MILDKVRKTIRRYRLLSKHDKILIGVSGGPDSVALLYLLQSLKKELKLTLHIAHLDHMLRKDSCKDRVWVEKLARRLNIPLTCAKINVKELARRGSQEEIARNARLGFLFKVACDTGASKIALGHNLDDQAETVLMRILRGSGLYGLAGILPKRNIAGYQIIRPLIGISRREIANYLKKKKIKSCIDPSNLKNIYFRNKIRNKLLPQLEKQYNRKIKEILANMAETIGDDYDYLVKVTTRSVNGLKHKLGLKKFLKLHPAKQRLVLRLMIGRVKGSLRRLELRHIREIEDLILNRPVNSVVDLPQGVSIVKRKNHFSFYRR